MGTIAMWTALLIGAARQDPIQGHGWATFAVGSWVKFRTSVEQGGKKIESELRVELVARGTESVVIERTVSAVVNGKPGQSESQRITVSTKDRRPDKVEEEGDEEIELGEKKLRCHWLEIRQVSQGVKSRVRMWFSPDIPGGLAKVLATPESGTGLFVRVTAFDWEKK